MILKTNKKDKNGKDIYVSAFTGRVVKLMRVVGKHQGKIPDGVYMRFIKPAIR